MDRAARSPFHTSMGHVGVRARAKASRCVRRLEVAVRRSADALAAARQQSYGCAYSDVRWGSTCTIFNINAIITIYISNGGCRNVYASGWLCVFSAPYTFHVHSSPTFCPTMYPTFIDVYFTRRFILYRSIECVFLAEIHTPTGCEPKDLTEEDTFFLVKPMFFHRQRMTSTYDSAESIATLLNRIWMMSKYAICWLHRCTYRREKQVPTDHEFITPSEKTQCQFHLTPEKVQGNLPQRSHTKESRVKKHFPTEQAIPQDINQFEEKTRVDTLNTCILEFQRQPHSNRLELDSVNCGYEESRREQARLHEDLALREKALPVTRIRCSMKWKN